MRPLGCPGTARTAGPMAGLSIEGAAAAAGWSAEDLSDLAADFEAEAAAAGWGMDDIVMMLDGSPVKDIEEEVTQRTSPDPCCTYEPASRATVVQVKPVGPDASTTIELVVGVASSGARFTMRCGRKDTLLSLKKRLHALTGILPAEQRLAAGGNKGCGMGGDSGDLESLGFDGRHSLVMTQVLGETSVLRNNASSSKKQAQKGACVEIEVDAATGCRVRFPYDSRRVKLLKQIGGGGVARWSGGGAATGAWLVPSAYTQHVLDAFPGATVLVRNREDAEPESAEASAVFLDEDDDMLTDLDTGVQVEASCLAVSSTTVSAAPAETSAATRAQKLSTANNSDLVGTSTTVALQQLAMADIAYLFNLLGSLVATTGACTINRPLITMHD